jgi:hypothetical protein
VICVHGRHDATVLASQLDAMRVAIPGATTFVMNCFGHTGSAITLHNLIHFSGDMAKLVRILRLIL